MEQWQKDFFEMLKTVADEVDQFFVGMSEMVESFLELSEEITDQVQNSIIHEVEQYWNELAEPLFEAYWEIEEFVAEVDHPFPYTVEPTLEEHRACIGCRNYHGQVYGGNLLVCGMHPYGWEGESCPDWEQE